MRTKEQLSKALQKARDEYEAWRIECESLAAKRHKVYAEIEQRHRDAMAAELNEAAGDLSAAMEAKREASNLVTRLERELEKAESNQLTTTESVQS